MGVLGDAAEGIDKEADEVELDYIIEKVMANRDKIILKPSRIPFTL